jgi:hypothetical protein
LVGVGAAAGAWELPAPTGVGVGAPVAPGNHCKGLNADMALTTGPVAVVGGAVASVWGGWAAEAAVTVELACCCCMAMAPGLLPSVAAACAAPWPTMACKGTMLGYWESH